MHASTPATNRVFATKRWFAEDTHISDEALLTSSASSDAPRSNRIDTGGHNPFGPFTVRKWIGEALRIPSRYCRKNQPWLSASWSPAVRVHRR